MSKLCYNSDCVQSNTPGNYEHCENECDVDELLRDGEVEPPLIEPEPDDPYEEPGEGLSNSRVFSDGSLVIADPAQVRAKQLVVVNSTGPSTQVDHGNDEGPDPEEGEERNEGLLNEQINKDNIVAKCVIDKQFAIADEMFKIQEWISQHWMANQARQVEHVQWDAYCNDGVVAKTIISCQSAIKTMESPLRELGRGATNELNASYSRYNVKAGKRIGAHDSDYAWKTSATHASHNITKYNARRFFDYQGHRMKYATSAYHASRGEPDAMFALMNNAHQLYSNVSAGILEQQKQKSPSGVGGLLGLIETGIRVVSVATALGA